MTTETETRASRRGQKPPRSMQIYYPAHLEESKELGANLARHLEALKIRVECASLSDAMATARLPEQEMIVALGGDGTMLRCGRMAARFNLPVLGINLGRLGFLTEVQPDDWKGVLARVLVGDYWVEERTMLRTEHYRGEEKMGTYDILNETVVSRGALARPIRLRASIEGDEVAMYVADGLIVSTATGSTAYALAVGGPILPPELENILMIPIAPHLCVERGIVLAGGVTVEIVVRTDHQAILSADGQVEVPLHDNDKVGVRTSPLVTRFVRVQEPTYFYRNLISCMSRNPSADKFK